MSFCLIRRRMWLLNAVSCVVLWGAGASLVWAQTGPETAFQLQQFRPWADPRGMFQTQSPQTLGHLKYKAGLFLNYAKDPLTLRDPDTNERLADGGIVAHQLGADLVVGLGVLSWLEVDLAIPMTVFQSGSISGASASFFATDVNRDQSGFAFSDIKLAIKAQALRAKTHMVDLGFQLTLGFPTGDETRFNGEDGVSFGLAAFLGKQIGRFYLGFNLGYRYLPRTEVLNLIINNELFYSLGARFTLLPSQLELIGDLTGSVAISEKTAPESAPFNLYLGARYYPLKNFDLALNAGLGIPLFLPGYGSPQIRVLLGLVWSPREYDTDKDGLLDRNDKCPKVPGPKENKGCPWPDTDGDGLKDNVDKCPKKAGKAKFAGCPDSDNDGVADPQDKCPTRPGPIERKGCPWPDTDGDGLKDNVDKCPKKAGPKENKGCPWPDTDKDGLKDNVDKCPKQAGPKENKGCPDTDRDNDKVVDRLDKCPDVPGTPKRQGCPKVVLARVVGQAIQILKRVQFRTNSSRIRGRRSFQVLNQVADVLRSRKQVRLRVEGHTDNRGRRSRNLILSQRRAASVRRYLIQKGIDASRMVAKGFGQSKPRASNKNRKGRAVNRRVEFIILSQ